MSKSSIGWRKAGISSLATAALVAGACVAGAGAANANTNFAFKRVDGPDRYGTSAAVAAQFGHADNIIVASGLQGHYADALAANYLAGIKSAPVLLTKKDSTPTAIDQAIKDSGATNVWVIGGTDVISQAQAESLRSENYTVNRLSGENRWETDAAVINQGGASSGEAIVATGLNFPDALGAGPLAYAKDMPIALSKTHDISDNVVAALQNAGVTKVLIAGGTDVVGPEVVAKLVAAGITVDRRFAGTDRADTAAQIAAYELQNGFTNTAVNVASGAQDLDGVDALGGGALSGSTKTPMLITKDVIHPGQATLSYLTDNANTLANGDAFGGPQAISDDAVAQMEKAAQSVTSNQSYTVNGGAANANTGDVEQYTVTGIDASKVDIVLAAPGDVNVNSANGVVTFNGTNPGGSGNTAKFTSTDATVTVLNGATAGTGSDTAYDTAVTGGTVTFTVQVGSDSYIPVVFSDNGDNLLSLNADSTPSESFGVGQATKVIPGEATSGSITPGTVTATDQAADMFQTDAGTNGTTYYYDSNDLFQVSTDNGNTYSPVTMAAFEAALSAGDSLTGTFYQSDPANQSSFALNDTSPAAPANVAADAPGSTVTANAGKAGVEVTWDNSATDSVASYNVYRATAIQPTVTGQSISCPTVKSGAYTKVGSVADKDASTTQSYSFLDTTAQPAATTGSGDPSYCYYVTSVDNSGEESAPSNLSNPQEASKAAPAQASAAPKFVAVGSSATGNTVTFEYSEPITTSSVDLDGSDYKVTVTDPSTGVTTLMTATAVASNSGGGTSGTATNGKVVLTLSGSVAAGDTVLVQAQAGADKNTVLDQSTPQEAQPTTDALQITAS